MISQDELLPWLISAGGPFIAIPDSVRGQWHGADPDSDFKDSYDTWGDYGRACQATALGSDAEHYVAVIDVGGAQALVLGEGGGPATFLHDRLLFVQYAPDGPESEFLAGLDAGLDTLPWQRSAFTWTVTSPAKLIDSAWPGDDPNAYLVVDIPPDTYAISFCDSGHIFVKLDALPAS
ncbi:Imm21 family immunity protein [Actinomadura coerulea]|uniref:Imm21 family immunity protein n=1 Tax=Actinomadura coerulea TaxID=46159 RepID=UPI003420D02A